MPCRPLIASESIPNVCVCYIIYNVLTPMCESMHIVCSIDTRNANERTIEGNKEEHIGGGATEGTLLFVFGGRPKWWIRRQSNIKLTAISGPRYGYTLSGPFFRIKRWCGYSHCTYSSQVYHQPCTDRFMRLWHGIHCHQAKTHSSHAHLQHAFYSTTLAYWRP